MDDRNRTLFAACKTSDLEKAEAMLEENIDVNVRDQFHWTALMYASKFGYYAIVVRLIAAGADVNACGIMGGRTSLMLACKRGHEEIVQELLKAGANVNAVDSENKTSLTWATIKGYSRIVDNLLMTGAKASIVSSTGRTCASYAKGNHSLRSKLDVVVQGFYLPSMVPPILEMLQEFTKVKLGWGDGANNLLPLVFEFLAAKASVNHDPQYIAGRSRGEPLCKNVNVRMVKVQKPEYNGAEGQIIDWVEEREMFRVQFPMLGKTLRVHPTNLEVDTKKGSGILKRVMKTGDFLVLGNGNKQLANWRIVTASS